MSCQYLSRLPSVVAGGLHTPGVPSFPLNLAPTVQRQVIWASPISRGTLGLEAWALAVNERTAFPMPPAAQGHPHTAKLHPITSTPTSPFHSPSGPYVPSTATVSGPLLEAPGMTSSHDWEEQCPRPPRLASDLSSDWPSSRTPRCWVQGEGLRPYPPALGGLTNIRAPPSVLGVRPVPHLPWPVRSLCLGHNLWGE